METDSSRTGYFVGKLRPETFRKLSRQLYMADLDNITADDKLCCDGSVKTLIVYYNGKKKYIKSMFPPDELRDLLATLYGICEDENLLRTDKHFRLEH
ncbi:hypothetical protein [Flavobacterium selenitireducens]|uniref:hypothetical protein n=1 Tax=Flavobacterium selenitireducens TaxID=2722704 RepID=UPI00168B82A0|nr:hypothetical protein [Flavobacterium selenitireducens]MBD3583341.1 hypothetical protein [Flavobacterium selenitireducens]